MDHELDRILKEICNNVNNYKKYQEFNLSYGLNVKDPYIKNLINDMNKKEHVICLYNSKTYYCDIIGVLDINNIRYIDFDDNYYTMENKGIDNQISNFIL